MNNDLMFGSKFQSWGTPDDLFQPLDAEFHFDIDLAACDSNTKCNQFLDEETDFLSYMGSYKTGWLNPPYGRGLVNFVRKAYLDVQEGRASTVVMLIPARTDTEFFHEFCMKAAEIRFLRGRVKFVDSDGNVKDTAPFPSMIVVFQKTDKPVKMTTMDLNRNRRHKEK